MQIFRGFSARHYLAVENPKSAISAIEKVRKEEMNHWIQYQKAKAELELGNISRALIDAKNALEEGSKDEDAKKNIAAYYDLYSKGCIPI